MAATCKLCSLILCTLCFSFLAAEAATVSLTVDFIHRDSPLSPLYNPLETEADRFYKALNRSIFRVNRLRPTLNSSKALHSGIMSSGGEHFMNFSIGTPPVVVFALVDTGSDLTWVQCKPCHTCYEQKPPLFDPEKSSTYKNVSCGADSCLALTSPQPPCDQKQNYCLYDIQYGDSSFSEGNIATETFNFVSTTGDPVSLPGTVFGCGHNNGGPFESSGSGVVGLAGSRFSFVSQISASIGGKFSYCLVPTSTPNATGKITFGNTDRISDPGFISTPLVKKEPSIFYFITLEAVSVGDKRLPYTSSSMKSSDLILDSGTTFTLLDKKFYNKLESAVDEVIHAERGSNPKRSTSLCYKGRDIELPVLTFHFTGGADVVLQPYNTFARVEEDLVCFAIVPWGGVGVVGNMAQINYLVEYDLDKRTVSFAPTDCTKL